MSSKKLKTFYKISILVVIFLIILSVGITIYALVMDKFTKSSTDTFSPSDVEIEIIESDDKIDKDNKVTTESGLTYIESKDEINENSDNKEKENIDDKATDDNKINIEDNTNNKPSEIDSIKDEATADNEDTSSPIVKESEAVTDEYFDDAVFIGNSQVEGIGIYQSMKNATIYAGKGIMVDTIFTKAIIKQPDGSRLTIMDCLSKNQFGKVYILLGANELGWPYDSVFIDKYTKVIEQIKVLQPNAVIYVSSLLPISDSKSTRDPIYNNKNVDRFNKIILQMSSDLNVNYLNSYEAVVDENGCLPEDAGPDGIHLNSEYYKKWFDYMKTHTVK